MYGLKKLLVNPKLFNSICFFPVGYTCSITMLSLLGYSNIPITGLTCSYDCAANFMNAIKKLNESHELKKQEQEKIVHNIAMEDWVGDHSYRFRRTKRKGRFTRAVRRIRSLFR